MARIAYGTFYKGLMNINEDGYQPWGWPQSWWSLVYQAWYPDIPLSYRKNRHCLHVKKLLHKNIQWSWKDRVLHRFKCIRRKSLRKTVLTPNTFKTSMSLRDWVKRYKWTLLPCLFTYVCSALKWLRGCKILEATPVEVSQWCFTET